MLDIPKTEQIFRPQSVRRFVEQIQSGRKMVHYTSAEAAFSIISNAKIWLRSTMLMNDFTEIEYGSRLMAEFFHAEREERKPFWQLVDQLTGGRSEGLRKHYDGWVPDLTSGTYVFCVSNHLEEEDLLGRLSMWRAYGRPNGVALVFNPSYLAVEGEALGTYSYPVEYWNETEAASFFDEVINNVSSEQGYLTEIGPEEVYNNLFSSLQTFALSIKHPGFREEREWRVMHRPNFEPSSLVRSKMVSVNGMPQRIYELSLEKNEAHGLPISIPELVHRIIVGPSIHGRAIAHAFVDLLADAGVPDAAQRVVLSEIPFRT